MSIELLRALQSVLPGAEPVRADAPPDDNYAGAYADSPCIAAAELIEDARLRSHAVEGAPEIRFDGFLDGIQRSHIILHSRGIPVVEGFVAAVIRQRVDRRLVTWTVCAPIQSRRVYMPVALLGCGAVSELAGQRIIDTSFDPRTHKLISRHPAALYSVALECVRRDREAAEIQLAECWCDAAAGVLCIDGGISSSARVASARSVVGVIKNHRVLFADGDALDAVMSLRAGERSSVFIPAARDRSAVASWYLRLRDPRERGAMFGLVRIEIAMSDDAVQRANDVSRWVMAESSPVSLPDNRWDRMSYGVRNCEQFLRAIA